jgi:NADH-quinone oxidoreductase subunit A
MTNPYVPLLFLAAIGGGFAVFSVVAGSLAGPKRYNRAKLDAYECGIEPTPHAAGGGRVPIKYYLTAMLFIVFDIEGVFLYPFAVAFNKLGLFALVEMVLFIITVFVAYAYVWRRGGLEWD